jgi:hypothetical protein
MYFHAGYVLLSLFVQSYFVSYDCAYSVQDTAAAQYDERHIWFVAAAPLFGVMKLLMLSAHER